MEGFLQITWFYKGHLKTHFGLELLRFTYLEYLAYHSDRRILQICEDRNNCSQSQKITPIYEHSRTCICLEIYGEVERILHMLVWQKDCKPYSVQSGKRWGKERQLSGSPLTLGDSWAIPGYNIWTHSFRFQWLTPDSRDTGLFTRMYSVATFFITTESIFSL